MKTKRIKEKIKNYLLSGKKSTIEIYEYVNSIWKYGVTMQTLGNVLSKDKDIIKLGHIRIKGTYGNYKIAEWSLKEN